jgi:hypothetical protein
MKKSDQKGDEISKTRREAIRRFNTRFGAKPQPNSSFNAKLRRDLQKHEETMRKYEEAMRAKQRNDPVDRSRHLKEALQDEVPV